MSESTGAASVEIKFQPRNEKRAKALLSITKRLVEKTQNILTPLPVNGIRIYLLQLDNAPTNYKILMPKKDDLFVSIKAFDSDTKIDLDCTANWFFCDEFYRTIPHELTHPALDEIVGDARWFEEGAAEYVGFETAKQTEPSVTMRAREIYVQNAMFKPNIINLLMNWDQSTFSKVISNKVSLKDIDFYSASQQLIRTVIAESEKNGVRQPLKVLLVVLQKMRRTKNKPADSSDIAGLIKTELKVDITKLNGLDQNLRQKLTDEAEKILMQNRGGNLNRQIKLYAVTTLKNTETTTLSVNSVKFLLRTAFDNLEDNLIKKLSASVLVSRFNQADFNKIAEAVCRDNACQNKKKIPPIKNEIKRIAEN